MFIFAFLRNHQANLQQPKLGAKEMADLEKELELDLENLDVNTDVSILESKLLVFENLDRNPDISILESVNVPCL